MEEMHGKTLSFNGITLIPTYHPAYILRSPNKFEAWFKDLEKAYNLSQEK
jgi:uracil-DNA glycosylase